MAPAIARRCMRRSSASYVLVGMPEGSAEMPKRTTLACAGGMLGEHRLLLQPSLRVYARTSGQCMRWHRC